MWVIILNPGAFQLVSERLLQFGGTSRASRLKKHALIDFMSVCACGSPRGEFLRNITPAPFRPPRTSTQPRDRAGSLLQSDMQACRVTACSFQAEHRRARQRQPQYLHQHSSQKSRFQPWEWFGPAQSSPHARRGEAESCSHVGKPTLSRMKYEFKYIHTSCLKVDFGAGDACLHRYAGGRFARKAGISSFNPKKHIVTALHDTIQQFRMLPMQ